MTNTILHLGLMEDGEIELDLAALELAALDHPGIDLDEYLDELTDIEIALRADDGDAVSSVAQAQALSSVMVEEFGFSGDRTHYDDPQNADLIAVVDRRLGLPISLSIIYVAMARRLGWSAMPLNTPGHVLVRLGDASNALIIDPFNDGRIVAPEQVEALLEQMTGQARFSDGMLPLSNRSALVRLLLNQATRAEQAGDPARALVLYDRMTIVAPTVERRGHALCPADLVLLGCGIPVEFERPAFRAVRQQAAQRQPDFDDVDARVRAARDTAPQDMHRQRDDNALMTDELGHQ